MFFDRLYQLMEKCAKNGKKIDFSAQTRIASVLCLGTRCVPV